LLPSSSDWFSLYYQDSQRPVPASQPTGN